MPRAARLAVMVPRPRDHRPLAVDASHWREDGKPKVRFATEAEALVAAHERGRQAGTDLGVYRCAFCAGWHMGRRDSRRER